MVILFVTSCYGIWNIIRKLELLENWIESGLITKFKTLQIQFHFEGIGPKDSDERMEKIQASLSHMGYTKKFGYCYVWECWQYNDKNTEL